MAATHDAWLVGRIPHDIDRCARLYWDQLVRGHHCTTPQHVGDAMCALVKQLDEALRMHDCATSHHVVHEAVQIVGRALAAIVMSASWKLWHDPERLEEHKARIFETAIAEYDALARQRIGMKAN